jgi:hypothetical protein
LGRWGWRWIQGGINGGRGLGIFYNYKRKSREKYLINIITHGGEKARADVDNQPKI